jgi:CRP-like cAMP-binding protein
MQHSNTPIGECHIATTTATTTTTTAYNSSCSHTTLDPGPNTSDMKLTSSRAPRQHMAAAPSPGPSPLSAAEVIKMRRLDQLPDACEISDDSSSSPPSDSSPRTSPGPRLGLYESDDSAHTYHVSLARSHSVTHSAISLPRSSSSRLSHCSHGSGGQSICSSSSHHSGMDLASAIDWRAEYNNKPSSLTPNLRSILAKSPVQRDEKDVSAVQDYICGLKTPFFRELPELVRADLAHHLTYHSIDADIELFHEGDVGDAMYILVGGAVSISMTKAAQEEEFANPNLQLPTVASIKKRLSTQHNTDVTSVAMLHLGNRLQSTSTTKHHQRSSRRSLKITTTNSVASHTPAAECASFVSVSPRTGSQRASGTLEFHPDSKHSQVGGLHCLHSPISRPRSARLSGKMMLGGWKAALATSPAVPSNAMSSGPSHMLSIDSNSKSSVHHDEVMVGVLRSGAPNVCIGEMALLDHNLRSATVRAVSKVAELLRVSKKAFDQVLKSQLNGVIEHQTHVLHQIEEFKALSATQLRGVARHVRRTVVKAGILAIHPNKAMRHVAILHKGTLTKEKPDEVKSTPSRSSLRRRTSTAIGIVNAIAAIEPEAFNAGSDRIPRCGYRAYTDCEIWLIPHQQFARRKHSIPQ